MPLDVQWETERQRVAFERLSAAYSPTAVDHVVERVAMEAKRELTERTPKGWTGATANAWFVIKVQPGERDVVNPTVTMRFLEYGTPRGAPGIGFIYPKIKKALYIPLTAAGANGWRPSLRPGIDYILRKKVRGMKPQKIVEKYQPVLDKKLEEALLQHFRAALGDV
jgi:hypothetical protein